MTEVFYAAVKGSLHANDSGVFGLKNEELFAIQSRFPFPSKPVVNGYNIKANPLDVINSLAELGYRVACSSGDTEIVWTLKREALLQDRVASPATSPLASPPSGRQSAAQQSMRNPARPVERIGPKLDNGMSMEEHQETGQMSPKRVPYVQKDEPIHAVVAGRPFVVQPSMSRTPVKQVERIGTKPEDWALLEELNNDADDKITSKHISSLERIEPGQKIILKTNLSSEFNPLSRRPGPRGAPRIAVPVTRVRPSQDDNPFPPLADQSQSHQRVHSSSKHTAMSHQVANPSVTQTLDEMDFERGLWYPAMQGDLAQIDKLLNKGVDVNQTDKSGYTPLHYAVRDGNLAVVRRLLLAGANVHLATKAGQATALHRAAAAGHLDVVKLLVEHGAIKTPVDSDGRTPLHRSAEAGHESTSLYLLQAAPEAVLVRDSKGLSPVEVARGSLGTVMDAASKSLPTAPPSTTRKQSVSPPKSPKARSRSASPAGSEPSKNS